MDDIKFYTISGAVIKSLIDEYHNDIYEIIKQTYLAHFLKTINNPPSYFLKFPEKPNSRIIALPAAICDPQTKLAGIKWIGSYPRNIENNLPRASAVIILNDYDTGFPYACLEGSIISAVRTSYSAVLASEYLHQHKMKISVLGIVGTGYIAKNIYNCFRAKNWEIENIFIYDSNYQRAEKFANEINIDNKINCKPTTIEKLLQSSSAIVFCTTALEPHINDLSLFKHKPIILHISLRDLSPEIIQNMDNIVDDIDHVLNANTSVHLAYKKANHIDFIKGTLGELIYGKAVPSKDKATIFSPMGMGVLDLTVANFLYQKAQEKNKTNEIKEFFVK